MTDVNDRKPVSAPERELRPVPEHASGAAAPGAVALDHVGIAVRNLEEALAVWRVAPGLEAAHVEEVATEGVRVAFLQLVGGVAIELLEPLAGSGSPVSRFLDKRGPGVHHLSFRVPDCRAAIRAAEAAGIHVLAPAPRPGSRGTLVAFFDPRDTGGVLIEVCERAE